MEDGSIIVKTKIDTSDIQRAQKEIEKLEADAKRLGKAISSAKAKGSGDVELDGLRKQLDSKLKEYDKLDKRIDSIYHKMEILSQMGKENTDAYKRLGLEVEGLDKDRDAMRAEISDLRGLVTAREAELETQRKSEEEHAKHKSIVDRLREAFGKLGKKIREVNNEGKKSSKSGGGLSLGKVLKYTLGIRSLYAAFNKLRSAAKESLGIMAQQIPEVNEDLSALMTGARKLKASVGTMLQPLLSSMRPVLESLMNGLNTVMKGLSEFFAALGGQNYIYEASVDSANWANELEKVNKETEKALGSYDKLDVISKNSSGGSDGGFNADTVKYIKKNLDNDSWIVKLGTKIRDVFKKLGEAEWFQKMLDRIKEDLNDPEKLLKDIGCVALGIALGKLLLNGIFTQFGLPGVGFAAKFAAVAGAGIGGYSLGKWLYEKTEIGSIADWLVESLADGTLGAQVKESWGEIFGDFKEKVDELILNARLELGLDKWEPVEHTEEEKEIAFENLKRSLEKSGFQFKSAGEKMWDELVNGFEGKGSRDNTILQTLELPFYTATNQLSPQGREIAKQYKEGMKQTLKGDLASMVWNIMHPFSESKKELKLFGPGISKSVTVSMIAALKGTWDSIVWNLTHPYSIAAKELKDKLHEDMWKSVGTFISQNITKGMKPITYDVTEGPDNFSRSQHYLKITPSVKLAKGGVIPANHEFMALLGDQRSGTNIEAPLDTIVKAMQIALKTSGNGGQNIVLNVSGKKMAEVVWDEQQKKYKQGFAH